MSRECVCKTCIDGYEKKIRSSNTRKYTNYKAETSNSHPCLGLFYIENDKEYYLRHAFETKYCTVCGKLL